MPRHVRFGMLWSFMTSLLLATLIFVSVGLNSTDVGTTFILFVAVTAVGFVFVRFSYRHVANQNQRWVAYIGIVTSAIYCLVGTLLHMNTPQGLFVWALLMGTLAALKVWFYSSPRLDDTQGQIQHCVCRS